MEGVLACCLRKGKTAGLTEGQLDNLLVDFERKDDGNGSESSEEDEDGDDDEEKDESATVPTRPIEEVRFPPPVSSPLLAPNLN